MANAASRIGALVMSVLLAAAMMMAVLAYAPPRARTGLVATESDTPA